MDDRVEIWKRLAQRFLEDDIRVYIKDIYENIYFADILFVGNKRITMECFGPRQRKGKKICLDWFLILRIEEYQGEVK